MPDMPLTRLWGMKQSVPQYPHLYTEMMPDTHGGVFLTFYPKIILNLQKS